MSKVGGTAVAPVFAAIDGHDLKTLEALLKANATLSAARGTGGRTPLIAIAMAAQATAATASSAAASFPCAASRAALAAGAELTAADGQHQTALHWALKQRHIPLATLLIEADAKATGASAAAAASASASAAASVLAVSDDFGRLPVHWAAQIDSAEPVTACLRVATATATAGSASRVNATTRSGETPLHWAASEGATAACHALVAAGANPCAVNDRGETPAAVARTEALRTYLTQLLSVAPASASSASAPPKATPSSPAATPSASTATPTAVALLNAPSAAAAPAAAAAFGKPKGKLTITLKARPKPAAP